jgi:hypothetical protein
MGLVNSKSLEEEKRKLRLNDIQRQVLVGILLGDAHLETQNQGRTFRLKVEQSHLHKEYLMHLYEVFREWVLTPPQEKHKRSAQSNSVNWWFQTVSHAAFRFYAHQFYRDGKKHVPVLIHRFLSERSLAYWFMDDGSAKWKRSRVLLLNTQGFTQSDVERLADAIRDKYAVQTYLRRQAEGWQIAVSGSSRGRFEEIVKPYLVSSMMYKIERA